MPSLRTPAKLNDIASAIGARVEGAGCDVRSVEPFSKAGPGTLSFLVKTAASYPASGAAIISAERPGESHWIVSTQPRLAFAKALAWLDKHVGFVRPTAAPSIDPSAKIGDFVSLGRGVVIGAGTVVESNVRIADGVVIGKDCWIKSGAVIGEAGFGFERDDDGTPIRMVHLGGVVIGDRVEVGSLTTVCQGTMAPTVLEDDAKIDDHVHIAHNVKVGAKAMVIACAEISGGVSVGEEAWVAPNASVLEGLTIGARSLVGLGAVVVKSVEPGATVVGNPAKPLAKRTP